MMKPILAFILTAAVFTNTAVVVSAEGLSENAVQESIVSGDLISETAESESSTNIAAAEPELSKSTSRALIDEVPIYRELDLSISSGQISSPSNKKTEFTEMLISSCTLPDITIASADLAELRTKMEINQPDIYSFSIEETENTITIIKPSSSYTTIWHAEFIDDRLSSLELRYAYKELTEVRIDAAVSNFSTYCKLWKQDISNMKVTANYAEDGTYGYIAMIYEPLPIELSNCTKSEFKELCSNCRTSISTYMQFTEEFNGGYIYSKQGGFSINSVVYADDYFILSGGTDTISSISKYQFTYENLTDIYRQITYPDNLTAEAAYQYYLQLDDYYSQIARSENSVYIRFSTEIFVMKTNTIRKTLNYLLNSQITDSMIIYDISAERWDKQIIASNEKAQIEDVTNKRLIILTLVSMLSFFIGITIKSEVSRRKSGKAAEIIDIPVDKNIR